MNEVSGKNKIGRIILIIGIICLVGIGLSFGYYLISRNQDENNVAGSKCFKLEITNQSKEIALDSMYPISDEEGRTLTPYSFTITNICDMLAGYTVNMEMLENTTLNSKYVDVMVNNEEIKLLTKYESTDTIIAGSTESRILANGTLAYNDSVDYTIRFWMDKDVEDADSMNKYFASKIVIQATPSTWNPKDAGYDTLRDAILANEYQSTPEDALNKISAKGAPDLSQTAPFINWVETTKENVTKKVIKPTAEAINSVTELNDLNIKEQYVNICTTKTFDKTSAKYSLSNCSFMDPTTLDFSGNVKYYYSNEYIDYNQISKKIYVIRSYNDIITVYQITGATKSISTQITNGVTYTANTYELKCTALIGTELETDKSDRGLYQDTDDYGTTYYYRGNVKNNNVYFAGFYWQIVRINGDGSIRLIYNGTTKNATDINQSIDNKTYQFNSKYDDPAYAGYMYGNPDATTFDEVHANTNDSSIKATVDSWYKINIEDKYYSKYLSTTVGFCGDRSLYNNSSGDGIQTDKDTMFGAFGRNLANTAQFSCPEPDRDLYTTTDAKVGNKALTYPIGLITYDEVVFAGMASRHLNRLTWIYSTKNNWTMSPAYYDAAKGYERLLHENSGYITMSSVSSSDINLRPVVNLKADVKISSGIGTSNDPFIIEE